MRRLHLPIQDPCHENWDAMHEAGDARRFCEMCSKKVHDISAMTEPEARSMLAEERTKGRVCVRYRMDGDGNIRFKTQTVEAPSVWRMTMAAAGMAVALLTGCADPEPDLIRDEDCLYEVGPWSFTVPRGEGTCPAEPSFDETQLMGAVALEPEPEPIPVMGEAPMVEPPPEPRMGKVEMADPEPPPEAEEIEIMGDVAVAEPCESEAPGEAEGPG